MAKVGDVNLGDRVKDTISGRSGIVMCISDWLYGCQRITAQPVGKDESFTVDVQQLKITKKHAIKDDKPANPAKRQAGGRPDSRHYAAPRR